MKDSWIGKKCNNVQMPECLNVKLLNYYIELL